MARTLLEYLKESLVGKTFLTSLKHEYSIENVIPAADDFSKDFDLIVYFPSQKYAVIFSLSQHLNDAELTENERAQEGKLAAKSQE